MDELKLGFRNRSALEQLTLCEQHATNITALPSEHRAQVRLQELTDTVAAARDSFSAVESLRSQLKAAITRRNQLLRDARTQTTYACGMVSVNVNLDRHAMLAAGLPLKSPRRPTGTPDAPGDFHGEPHDNEGAARLRWKRPLRRCFFEIEARTESETEWKLIASSVATKCVIEDLTSGVKYWFRVSAGNAHGRGPWSNPVSVRVK